MPPISPIFLPVNRTNDAELFFYNKNKKATLCINADVRLPVRGVILATTAGLAQCAAISQAAGLTPIVKMEFQIEGSHSPELFAEARWYIDR